MCGVNSTSWPSACGSNTAPCSGKIGCLNWTPTHRFVGPHFKNAISSRNTQWESFQLSVVLGPSDFACPLRWINVVNPQEHGIHRLYESQEAPCHGALVSLNRVTGTSYTCEESVFVVVVRAPAWPTSATAGRHDTAAPLVGTQYEDRRCGWNANTQLGKRLYGWICLH